MRIPTKDEYFKKLKSDKDYQAMLKAAPADERKKIINTVDTVMSSMFDVFSTIAIQMKQDPSVAKKIEEVLKDESNIIKESDGSPITPKEK